MDNDNIIFYDPRLYKYGFEVGGYTRKCKECGKVIEGVAKLAWACFECAEKRLRKELDNPITINPLDKLAATLRKTLFGEDDRGWNLVDEPNRKAWREKAEIFESIYWSEKNV